MFQGLLLSWMQIAQAFLGLLVAYVAGASVTNNCGQIRKDQLFSLSGMTSLPIPLPVQIIQKVWLPLKLTGGNKERQVYLYSTFHTQRQLKDKDKEQWIIGNKCIFKKKKKNRDWEVSGDLPYCLRWLGKEGNTTYMGVDRVCGLPDQGNDGSVPVLLHRWLSLQFVEEACSMLLS